MAAAASRTTPFDARAAGLPARGRNARRASGVPITSGGDDAQRLVEQFLAGLVTLQDDDLERIGHARDDIRPVRDAGSAG